MERDRRVLGEGGREGGWPTRKKKERGNRIKRGNEHDELNEIE